MPKSAAAVAALPMRIDQTLDMVQKGHVKVGMELSSNEKFSKDIRAAAGLIAIAPSVPRDWDHFEMEKDFRGCHLKITVHNDEHREAGCRRMLVNGKEVPGNYIPQELLTKVTEVEMWM